MPHRRASERRSPARKRPARTAPVRTVFEISAGGVVWRRTKRGVEICLIATRGGTRWQLPKGKREADESIEETAAREVREETGLLATVGPRLDKLDLWFTWEENGKAVRHHKLVYFFLLAYVRGDTADHDAEVDDARWFPAAEALPLLTFASERRVVERALALLAAEASATALASGRWCPFGSAV